MSTAVAGAATFQQQFAQALLQTPDDARASDAATPWATHPAFAVYRNTVMKGCIDALEANFPSVARLVGTEWFRAAAAVYVRAHPPTDPRLFCYGIAPGPMASPSFADFLAGFEPAQSLPYLGPVAQLDAAWCASHTAADAPAADPGVLAALAPGDLGRLHLRPHPAARWIWHEAIPVHTLWTASRQGTDLGEELQWRGEGALLTRPHDSVQWCALERGACALLDACADGSPLAAAAHAAQQADPGCDLAGLLALLLQQGAFQQPLAAPSS